MKKSMNGIYILNGDVDGIKKGTKILVKNQPMKTYPKGTTKEQWDQYELDLKLHELRMSKTEPCRCDYATKEAYDSAHSKWQFDSLMDAPNEPGYYRANND